ncbi:hypothetical protein AMJ85_00020 [candidate division BRC1 bacterium SM23_51]|nr:MAG: hypothetical protein AMJ85_00020 [candidate division BRC1 bacterium SM23_51]
MEETIKKKLNFTASAEMRDRILDDILKAQEKSKQTKSAIAEPNIGRIIMKSRIAKLAVAAVIIIMVLVGIHQLGGPIDGTSVTWAGVVEKIDKINSYIYRERRSATSGPQKEGFEFIAPDTENIVYCSAIYGTRTDNYQSGELRFSVYALAQEKAIVSVLHFAKDYTRIQLPDGQKVGRVDPREMVRHILSNDYTELGCETIDGFLVEGAELTGQRISGERVDDAVTRLWVDVETGLPVRIELEGLAYGTSTKVKIVQDEFQWNVELLAGDFEPNIPPDYTFVEQELPSEPEPEIKDFATAQDSRELDLPDLGDLNLLGLEDSAPQTITPLVGYMEIWKAQDRIVSTWPAYSDVEQQLYEELQAKLDIENLSSKQLVATAVALREMFWEKGGRLSQTSYPYGYAARIILETAHDKNPEDLTITDELVETMQTIELFWSFQPDSDERIRNMELRTRLKWIRGEQFEQIKQELETGRELTWEDFVRVNDLAILCGWAKDFEQGLVVVAWLIEYAELGGWTVYLRPLGNMQNQFGKGEKFNYNILTATGTNFPEEYRYHGLPSFKGPRKRAAKPVHILDPNPVWHGD